MGRERLVRLEDLPLFASDAEIAAAVVGQGRAHWWVTSILPTLEKTPGFPPYNHAHKGRYTPAVRRFYDAQNGLIDRAQARQLVPDRPEGTWTSRGSRTRRA